MEEGEKGQMEKCKWTSKEERKSMRFRNKKISNNNPNSNGRNNSKDNNNANSLIKKKQGDQTTG